MGGGFEGGGDGVFEVVGYVVCCVGEEEGFGEEFLGGGGDWGVVGE